MNFTLLLSILFELLEKGKATAPALAKKHAVAERTVYRYVEKLRPFLPLSVRKGRGGGIFLADNYRLPLGFFNDEEYEALLAALQIAYAHHPEPRFLAAKRKLYSTRQTPASPAALLDGQDVLVLPNAECAPQILSIVGQCVRDKRLLRLLPMRESLDCERTVEPHLLLVNGAQWYLYAFCHTERKFLLLPLAEIRGVLAEKESFRPRPFDRAAIEFP